MGKLWGGRFNGVTDELMKRFNDSIAFDRRLYRSDIQGSIAYAAALAESGLITQQENEIICEGLDKVQSEFESGAFQILPGDEDIHTAVERRLGELVGPVAGKLHTGRSRNDQVATDMRLYLLSEISALGVAVKRLQAAIVTKSEQHIGIVMPGYTHLQHAQPLLFSHWLMSYFWKLERDSARLADLGKRTSILPLGCGALAGNPFRIDREALAEKLGFSGVAENSVDAVSDRDFVVEFLAWASILQVHLSSLAEDLIIWSSREFGFLQVDEAYATGSSLMPQKRNPDSLELVRGKTGRVIGHLLGLLMTLKGLPSSYNKDLQEDKEGLFDVIDSLLVELPVVESVIRTLNVNAQRMSAALDDSMLATDLADYLVRKGVPFRRSHELVGKAVKRSELLGVSLRDLPLPEYVRIDGAFGGDVTEVFDFRASVEARDARGGTATASVREQLARARECLEHKWL
jgi:argininosuccinate lyase